MKKVLVTGATGFLGSHTIIQLLNKGYSVVGTLRDLKRADEIRKTISKHVLNTDFDLKLEKADLTDTDVWFKLTEGIDFVQHVASPFPTSVPKDENELIIPAKQGVLNILAAASKNKVKRFVLTSSDAAVVYGKRKSELNKVFDESDWTDVNYQEDLSAYVKSKAIAEIEAWKFIENDHSGMEFSAVLPGAILGPVLEKDFGNSANMVIKMFDGTMPLIPKIGYPVVDVRSVAELLILAMEQPQAAGNRYIASNGFAMMKDVADIVRKAYPNHKIPKKEFPNFVLRIIAKFDTSLGPTLINLNSRREVNTSKAQKELKWKPKSVEEAVLSCAKSLFELQIIK